jgi:hypothetical protein
MQGSNAFRVADIGVRTGRKQRTDGLNAPITAFWTRRNASPKGRQQSGLGVLPPRAIQGDGRVPIILGVWVGTMRQGPLDSLNVEFVGPQHEWVEAVMDNLAREANEIEVWP